MHQVLRGLVVQEEVGEGECSQEGKGEGEATGGEGGRVGQGLLEQGLETELELSV